MLRRSSMRLLVASTSRSGFMPHEPNPNNPLVYFDITAGELACARVTVELFSDTVPQLAENFRSLCTGERGYAKHLNYVPETQKPYFYKGIPFHRIIPGFIVQGGDILHQDGRGNESSFGFDLPDESFTGKAGLNLSGTVAMANKGPHRNGCQFFFNLTDSPHLNGKSVVVGQVVDGWGTVEFLGDRGSRSGTPTTPCWIADCGQSGEDVARNTEDLEKMPNEGRNPFIMPGRDVVSMLRSRNDNDRKRTPWEHKFE